MKNVMLNCVLNRFVLRSYGISGLQNYIRRHIELAKRFEQHVLKDKRFEICNQVKVSDNCFQPIKNKPKAGTYTNLTKERVGSGVTECFIISHFAKVKG